MVRFILVFISFLFLLIGLSLSPIPLIESFSKKLTPRTEE